jgi:predicted Fe-S protein YdhL (DUF1289 family)
MADPNPSPESPCIDVCAIDTNKVCIGCYRNLDEIAAWSRCTDERKRQILDTAKQRQELAE